MQFGRFDFRFEVEEGVFEGGTDFGAVSPEDAERDLVPDDLPVGMSMQEMVMSRTEQDTVLVTGLTTVFPIFDVVAFTPSGWDLTPRPPAALISCGDPAA